MEKAVYLGTLAAVFGAASWAGFAISAPGGADAAQDLPAETSDPPPPVAGPAPLGDLDSGRAPRRKPPAGAGAPLRLTFDDISQWDLDPKSVQFPASILALSGKDVDIVGYMVPYGDPESVEEFALFRDLGSCCFGLAPQPHHLVECRFEKGKRAAWSPGPVRVRGRFKVAEHRQGQFLVSVFSMTVTDCVEVR